MVENVTWQRCFAAERLQGEIMEKWQRRILGILDLGGGFLGFVMGATILFRQVSSWSPEIFWSKVLAVPFLALYCWGMWCGVRTLEDARTAKRANLWFWGIQIPCFMSPIAGYVFACGATAIVSYIPETSSTSFLLRVGSQFQYSLLEGKPLQIGINCFALVVCLLLLVQTDTGKRREDTAEVLPEP